MYISNVRDDDALLRAQITRDIFRVFTHECGMSLHEFAQNVFGKIDIAASDLSDDFTYHEVMKYFERVVVPHKIAVLGAGMDLVRNSKFRSLNINEDEFVENLTYHDISKFGAQECIGYALHNFNSKSPDIAFDMAWHHHKCHNQHHPEYWQGANRRGEQYVLPMPKIFVAEMVADWIGAGNTYGNPIEDWLKNNISDFVWHKDTAIHVQDTLRLIPIDTGIDSNGVTLYVK